MEDLLPIKGQFSCDHCERLINIGANSWYIATRKEDLAIEEFRQRAAQARYQAEPEVLLIVL